MISIDEAARRLGLTSRSTHFFLAEVARNWKTPSLAVVILLSGLKNHLKKIGYMVRRSGGATGFSPDVESSLKSHISAVGASAAISVASFLASKLWYLYSYLSPLNRLSKHAYIDSRHGPQVESHKWLTCILEASPEYKRSRDLEASTFQSVRERQTSDDSITVRIDKKGVAKRCSTTKTPLRSPVEVPVYFQPRNTGEIWLVKFGTLFRISKENSTKESSAALGGPTSFLADGDYSSEPAITVRCFSRTRKPLMQLLAYAKDEYLKGFEQNLFYQVFVFDGHHWSPSPVRKGRGLDTIVIPDKTKQKLLGDVEEFLESQDWYSSRGIPWKRGIMFSGPPGNGKSSTIQALASTFDLPIYILPVASPGFNDAMLSRAVSRVASKCILVLEDFDAFQMQNSHRMPAMAGPNRPVPPPGSGLSLSAILNVLDGIDSGEGRIVIASTNHLNFLRFDEALLRPGRFDLFIEFRMATQEQARDLFLRFHEDYRSKVGVLDNDINCENDLDGTLTPGCKEVRALANEFKDMVEDEEFSVATLQGHLIAYKTNPHLAVQEMPRFVTESRKTKKAAHIIGSERLTRAPRKDTSARATNSASSNTDPENAPENPPKVLCVAQCNIPSDSPSVSSESDSESSDSTNESKDGSSAAASESSITSEPCTA